MILYEGPSELDPSVDIVAILTGYGAQSKNEKIGPIPQVYILLADLHPMEALKTGLDRVICGSCDHRPIHNKDRDTARCYVTVHRAPASIWRAYQRGAYTYATKDDLYDSLTGAVMRWGAYGDPLAIPKNVLKQVQSFPSRTLGYTHQWKNKNFQWAKNYFMASVDSGIQKLQAESMGWRIFGVGFNTTNSMVCPASKERGHRVSCNECLACSGNSSVQKQAITIAAH